MPRVRPLMALLSVSLKVPAPAGDSFDVSHTMRNRPVSLVMSPTVAVPRPSQDPTGRVTATIGWGPDGFCVQLSGPAKAGHHSKTSNRFFLWRPPSGGPPERAIAG